MNSKLAPFIRYVKIDTQSVPDVDATPSTEKQKNLGLLLVHELQDLGLEDAHMDEYGRVYAHLPGKGSRIGLCAHMDTATEVTGANVQPHLIKEYKGGTIKLTNGLEMSPKDFPVLNKHIGHDLVVTDGNTLLGADDKAGIAIIMNVLRYFKEHPEEKHSTICVAFTCDEEVGEGHRHFDYQTLNAKYAYTLDGATIDRIEAENFNAAKAVFYVRGVSIHPGEGKDKLINAIPICAEFLRKLPENDTPFYSEGNQGFWHATDIKGNAEIAYVKLIIRDFKEKGLQKRLDLISKLTDELQEKYPTARIDVRIKRQYDNMKPYISKKPMAVKRAKAALKKNGIEPKLAAIRGGTDGAHLSQEGLPTPNLGTASYNHHGRYEFLDVQEYEKMIDVVIDLVR